jgi:hypothetical protein
MCSTTFDDTEVSDPSDVMTRLRSTTVVKAGFSCTRASYSGSSSSRAVASRIVPRRCSAPSSSR